MTDNKNKMRLVSINDTDVREALQYEREFGIDSGTPLGFPNLNANLQTRGGEHCIVYGAPNTGKTTWVYSVVINQARYNGKKTLIWCPEEFSTKHIYRKLMHMVSGKPLNELNDKQVDDTAKFINDYFRVLETPRLNVFWESIESGCREYHKVWKFDNTVFDHAGMFEQELDYVKHIREIMNNMIDLSVELNIFTWMVNHIAKPKLHIDKTGFYYMPPPPPEEMSGGQTWYKLCFNCVNVYRPDARIDKFGVVEETEVWIYFHKVKNPDSGFSQRIHKPLYFDKHKQNYQVEIIQTEVEPPEDWHQSF